MADAPQGVYTNVQIAGSRRIVGRVCQLGERHPAARDRSRRSGDRRPHVPHVVHDEDGRVDRLAAAARVLVHRTRRPPHPQLRRAAAGSTSRRSIRSSSSSTAGTPTCGATRSPIAGTTICSSQPGFVVLLTDYRGSTGYGEKFTLDIQGDPLAGPADDINDAADEAIKRFAFIDGTRQAAGGASYGGHLTNWLAGTTTRYRCLVSHAGLATLEMQWGISDGIYHRELMMGGPYWENPAEMDCPEPAGQGRKFQDADAALGRAERFPRARGQHADDVLGAAADERSDATAHLA